MHADLQQQFDLKCAEFVQRDASDLHAWEDGGNGIDALGGVLKKGEHVVEDAGVHDAVEMDDADVAGE